MSKLEDLEHAEVKVCGDSVIIRYPRAELRESLTRCAWPTRVQWVESGAFEMIRFVERDRERDES